VAPPADVTAIAAIRARPEGRSHNVVVRRTMRWTDAICGVVLLAGSNALAQVQPDQPTRSEGAGPVDQERARALESRLAADPVLRDDTLTIEVTGKRVRLSGTVDNADERAHAEQMVLQSDPTLTVENLLQTTEEKTPPSASTPSDDKVSASAKRAAHEAKKAAAEAGAMINDGWITSKIKAQLMAADGVHASAIDVDTTDHVVTLRGHVQSTAERKRVMHIVWHTRGVDRVVDQLVSAPKQSENKGP
jgi:hyperosmotically inducible protein